MARTTAIVRDGWRLGVTPRIVGLKEPVNSHGCLVKMSVMWYVPNRTFALTNGADVHKGHYCFDLDPGFLK